MTRESTPLRAVEIEASPEPAAPFRDRLAARCVEFDAAYPRALDLEARVLVRLHGTLRGVAALVPGLHTPRRFREALIGERHFRLADLCRLATEPTREAREAARAAVGELAAALGFRLEPIDAAAPGAHEALATMMESNSALSAEAVRDLGDGILTADEARDLRPELEAHKASVAKPEAVINEAERRGRDGGDR